MGHIRSRHDTFGVREEAWSIWSKRRNSAGDVVSSYGSHKVET